MRAAAARPLWRRPFASPAVAAAALAALAFAGGFISVSLALALASALQGRAARLHVGAGEGGLLLALLLAASLAPRALARLGKRSRQIRGRTVLRVSRIASGAEAPEQRIAVGRGSGPWVLGRAGAPTVDTALPTDAVGAVARLTRLGAGWQVEALGEHHVYGADGMPRRSMRLNTDGWLRVADVRLRLGVRGGGPRLRRAAPAGREAAGAGRRRERRGRVRVERTPVDSGVPALVADRVERAHGMLGRAWGLLGRTQLGAGEGLWIEPCNAVHALFMRMTVDAVYVDVDGRVVKVVAPLRPWCLGPVVHKARAVLELPEGAAAASGIRVGDRLTAGPP